MEDHDKIVLEALGAIIILCISIVVMFIITIVITALKS